MSTVRVLHSPTSWPALFLFLLWSCSAPPPRPVPCEDRALFGDPAESPYVLPYPAGSTCYLNQSYCNPSGGHRDQLAYDFLLPVGADVVAARDGVVRKLHSEAPDGGGGKDPGRHNHVLIEHDDGTVAFYAHLQQGSVAVDIGDRVIAGQRIAASGNSGNTRGTPHLHFGVYEDWPAVEGFDVPVNFRNADGPLDERGGLIAGRAYTAR